MISKLNIGKFGLFNDYVWDKSIGREHTFKRLNIIYGRNYSGKTTLSRILKCIEDERLHKDYGNAKFSLTLTDNTTITEKSLATTLKVRVYNSDFIRENLNWLHNEDGSIKPFTILGSQNIELQNSIQNITLKLDGIDGIGGLNKDFRELQASIMSQKQEYIKNEKELEDTLRRKANDKIKIDPNLFLVTSTKKTYSISDIKYDISSILDSIDDYILDSNDEAARIALLKEELMPNIDLLQEAKPNFQKYYDQVKDLISRKIKPSQPITALLEDNLLQEWVRQGIDKHKGIRMHCGFCGSKIGDDLWHKLDAHFSKESEELRTAIIKQTQVLNSAKENIQGWVKIEKGLFYSTLGSEFDSIFSNWQNAISTYVNNLHILNNYLEQRLKDIFTALEIQEIEDNSDVLLDTIKQFNRIINFHNKKNGTLSIDQENARLELRKAHLAQFVKDIEYKKNEMGIDTLKSRWELDDRSLSLLNKEIEQLKHEKEKLEAEAKDETRGAEIINKYLSHFFGHQDLKLVAEPGDPSTIFKIVRGESDAKNLSEGESRLISFCYFIAKMEDELNDDTNLKQLVIYIDDPISSLDSNHIFFLFSLIENIIAKPNRYGQLFISTHNLDFLKYLRKLTIPKYKPQANSRDKVDMLQFTIQRINSTTTSLLIAPKYLNKYITEFNYLFSQILKCSIAEDNVITHELQYNFSNNVRKFLESYLFFKYPSHGISNDERIKKYFGNDSVSATLIGRIANEYSHMEEQFDRGIHPIDLSEIRRIANLILKKIEESDPDQYSALLDSIDHD